MKILDENAIRFLNRANVIAIHADTISQEGGAPGIRDVGLLDSAIAMPQQRWAGTVLHPGLAAKAAAYLYHITANHAFIDGNKRTGALAALVFLDLNGIVVNDLPLQEELERVTLEVASGSMSKEELTVWMRSALNETDAPNSTRDSE